MSKSSSSIKKTIKLRIFNILYSLICKSQESSFAQLKYKSLSFRILAYFAGDDLQKKVVWFKAAENGDTKRISQIYDSFENKADIDIMDEQGHTALHIATLYGHIDIVKILIKAGADINTQDKNGNIPLNLALGKKNEAIISLLKEAEKLNNALHKAASNGDFEEVKRLIKSGANANSKNENGNTVLHEAVLRNDINIVKKLIELKPKLLEIQGNYGYTALYLAVGIRNASMIETLIKSGANANYKGKYGNTVLHEAVIYRENTSIVEMLIKAGADVNSKDINGNTALHRAVIYQENTSIVEMLIKARIDVNSKNMNGDTALHNAVFVKNVNMIEKLIEAGIDVNFKNMQGNSAWHNAVLLGDVDIVKKLIELEPKLLDTQGQNGTALHIAVSKNNMNMFETLIEAGANLQAIDEDGSTALHDAILAKMPDMVKRLIELEPKLLETQGQYAFIDGYTALHIAISEGDINIVEILIKAGANLNATNKNGSTPLDLALKKGDEEILFLLKKAIDDRKKQTVTEQNLESLILPSGSPRLKTSQDAAEIQQTKT